MSAFGALLVCILVGGWRYRTVEFSRSVSPSTSGEKVGISYIAATESRAAPIGTPQGRTRWQLRSKHFLFGMPEIIDDRYKPTVEGGSSAEDPPPELSVLVREGFVIGHLDDGKVPLWMCMKWNRENLVASSAEKERRRRFEVDQELPEYAQGESDYNQAGFDRGHLARNKDNVAWGEDNALSGDLMSNIVPQLPALNRGPWYELEKVVSVAPERRVAKHQTFWVIAGSVFEGGQIRRRIGNEIGVPDSFYKIVAWYDMKGRFKVMAFLFPSDATIKNPTFYLTSVDKVEECTGLDFFPAIDSEIGAMAESVVPREMWGE